MALLGLDRQGTRRLGQPVELAIHALLARERGPGYRERLRRGMDQVARFWRPSDGDAKVFEIYKYLGDRRTGVFPMGVGAWEGKDTAYEFGYIRDPVKMINVYSLGYCDMLGPTMAGIMQRRFMDIMPIVAIITVLSGFYLFAVLHSGNHSVSGMVLGTASYMAPEQTGRMNRSIDSRSDLYALGATAFFAFSGRFPFAFAATPIA